MELRFGATAPKLHEQLECKPEKVEQHQKDLDAITRLRVRGILTHSEVKKAELRVIKSLNKISWD